jgi:hypothetical protein
MHKTNIRINKEAIIIIYHHGINFVTLPKVEGPIRRTRGGDSTAADKNSSRRRWSLQQDEHGFRTRLRLTTQIGQVHVATGVLLNLRANTQPSDPKTQRNTKPRVHWPTSVRPVSTTGQTGPYWWNLVTSTEKLHTGQAGATHRSDRSQPESPKTPNRSTDLQTDPNSKQPQYRTTANCWRLIVVSKSV